MTEFIIPDSDYEMLKRANDNPENKKSVVEIAQLMGYEVNKKLINELIHICNFDLDLCDMVNVRIYVSSGEEKKNWKNIVLNKISELYGKDTIELLTHAYTNTYTRKRINREGLVAKNIRVPKYIRDLYKMSNLDVCTTEKEILEF